MCPAEALGAVPGSAWWAQRGPHLGAGATQWACEPHKGAFSCECRVGAGGRWQLDAFFLPWRIPAPLHGVSPSGGAPGAGSGRPLHGGTGPPHPGAAGTGREVVSLPTPGRAAGPGCPHLLRAPEASVGTQGTVPRPPAQGSHFLARCFCVLRRCPAPRVPWARSPFLCVPGEPLLVAWPFLCAGPSCSQRTGRQTALEGDEAPPAPPDHSGPSPGLGN